MLCLNVVCVELVLYIHFVFVLFFFFKQKTAYEMRISDWSSDVCSSDLRGPHLAHWRREMGAALHSVRVAHDSLIRPAEWRAVGGIIEEIGRASCRERVCLYV